MSIDDGPPAVNPDLHDALQALSEQAGWSVRLMAPPELLTGGYWAEMWKLTVDGAGESQRTIVVRLAPDPELAAREAAVQRSVAAMGFATPAVLAVGVAESGRRFTVMDFAEGRPLLAGLSGPRALLRLPRLARTLPTQLAEITARLHQLDPEPVRHALEARGLTAPSLLALVERFHLRAVVLGDERLMRCAARLAESVPTTAAVIVHGDIHPFNLLDHHGALTLIDWTTAQLAPAAYDVAFTALLVSHPPLAAPRLILPVIAMAGRALAKRFTRSYQRRAGLVAPADLEWFTRLAALRILLDVAAWKADNTLDNHRGHPWLSIQHQLWPIIG